MRVHVVCVCLLFIAVPDIARSQGTNAAPYRLTLHVQFPTDPVFTPLYCASLISQARDQLRNYFGPLSEVVVTDRRPDQPTVGQSQADDKPAAPVPDNVAPGRPLDPALLDDPKILTAVLSCHAPPQQVFVAAVDYVDGTYIVQERFLETQTRYLSPMRTIATPDREWLVKAICLSVCEGFAPIATVTPQDGASEVKIEFQGAEHADRLKRWIGPNSVMQPYWIVRGNQGELLHQAIPHTYLRNTESIHSAKVITAGDDPWRRTTRVAGFLAIKLPTRQGRIRVRLVNETGAAPVRNYRVAATDKGFAELSDRDILSQPDATGSVESERAFAHLAYIRLTQGTGASYQLALPITLECSELVCQVSVDKAAVAKNRVQRELMYVAQDLQVLQTTLNLTIQEVNQLNDGKRYEEALRKVTSGLNVLQPATNSARHNVTLARSQAAGVQAQFPGLVEAAEAGIKNLDQGIENLNKLTSSLRQTVEKVDAQSRADVLIQLASEEERQGNIAEALERYALALKEQPDQPVLAKKLADMEETWRIKSPAHQAARDTIFNRWANCPVSEIGAALPEAERAFQTCASVGDHLSLIKLVNVNHEHVTSLSALVSQLVERNSSADLEEATKHQDRMKQLDEFQQQVNASLTGQNAGSPPASKGTNDDESAPSTSPPVNDSDTSNNGVNAGVPGVSVDGKSGN